MAPLKGILQKRPQRYGGILAGLLAELLSPSQSTRVLKSGKTNYVNVNRTANMATSVPANVVAKWLPV